MKKKWLGITLALLVVVAAAVTVVMFNNTKTYASGEYKLTISTEKTVFSYGEDIVINYDGVTSENFSSDGTWEDVELRLELGHDVTSLNQNGLRWGYIDMTLIDGETQRAEKGSVLFPTDCASRSSAVVPTGKYTVWARTGGGNGAQVSNKLEIEVVIPQYPIQLELTGGGTDVAIMDGVSVNFSGMYEELFKKADGTTWMDVELRLMAGHGLTDAQMLSAKLDYADLGPLGKGTHAVLNTTITESGVRVFTADGTNGDNFAGNALKDGKYTLAVFLYDSNSHYTTSRVRLSNVLEINIYQTLITTNKTQYAFGEDIVVHHAGLPKVFYTATTSANSEMLIYKDPNWFGNSDPLWGVPSGLSYAGSEVYVELGSQSSYTVNDYPVPAGDIVFLKNKSGVPLAPGKYRVVSTYQPDGGVRRASNYVEFEILPPEISMSKTDFGYGEDVTVSYKNVGAGLQGKFYVEIGMFPQGSTVGAASNRNKKYYGVHPTGVTTNPTSGSFSFNKGFSAGDWASDYLVPPGDYMLVLRTCYITASDNTCPVGTSVVNFTVHAPEITLDKTEYEFGEAITMDYAYLTKTWLQSGSNAWLSVDIFNRNTVPAGNQNEELGWTAAGGALMESVIFNHTGTSYGEDISEAESGSLSFPDSDNDNKKKNFPLAPGKYHVVVRSTNNVISEGVIEFTVKEPKLGRAVELKNSISMHYYVTCGDALSTEPMMKFTLGSATFDAVAAYEKVEENGLITYKFRFDDILPQEMTVNLKAELVVNGSTRITWDNYSIQQNAMNLLEDSSATSSYALVVALLNYGTEAQLYFNQNTENLANSKLSDEQKAYLTSTDMSAADAIDTKLDGVTFVGNYGWQAVTLDLQSSLSFRLKFLADDISLVTISDGVQNFTYASHPELFLQAANRWYFYYENIYANEFADQFDISMTVEGQQGTSTVHYSVDSFISYINGKSDGETNAKDICQALYDYGIQATEYSKLP